MPIRTARMLLKYTECYPKLIRALSEYPESYSESIEIAQRRTYKYFSYRMPIWTPILLLKRTECIPSMIRSLT